MAHLTTHKQCDNVGAEMHLEMSSGQLGKAARTLLGLDCF